MCIWSIYTYVYILPPPGESQGAAVPLVEGGEKCRKNVKILDLEGEAGVVVKNASGELTHEATHEFKNY